MAFNGAGVFVRLYNWVTDKANGIKVRADRMDAEMDGIATGLSNCVTKDGQTTITANLPMAGFKLTGLGAGTANGDSVRYEQVLRNAGASWTAEVAVASAGTCDILGAASEKIEITGTTTITSFGTGTNKVRLVRFSGALTLTHNATSLILPAGANIKTAAGDTCIVISDGSSNARVLAYQKTLTLTRDLYGALAGGTTAYTVTTDGVLTALATGVRVHSIVNATNTGASTLAVDSLTAKAIRRLDDAVGDIAIAAGEMPKNFHAIFQYDASANSAAGAWIWINAPRRPVKGHLHGLTLSNNGSDATNDIDVAAGVATDSTGTVSMVLSSAITKQLDASWAVGTNAGGKSSAAAIANTTYFVYLIYRSDTGVVDVCMDVSASGPTMPANYTHYRRIGAILRESAAIVAFVQDGDLFMRSVPVQDVNTSNPGTSAVTSTLSVPVGLRVLARITQYMSSTVASTTYALLASDLSMTDSTPSAGSINTLAMTTDVGALGVIGAPYEVMTNTSAQIRYRINSSAAGVTVRISTNGWVDTRGRLA